MLTQIGVDRRKQLSNHQAVARGLPNHGIIGSFIMSLFPFIRAFIQHKMHIYPQYEERYLYLNTLCLSKPTAPVAVSTLYFIAFSCIILCIHPLWACPHPHPMTATWCIWTIYPSSNWLRNLWRLRISWITPFGTHRCSLSNQTNAFTAQNASGHTVQCLYLNECEWVVSVWVSPFMGTDCVMTALPFCGALSSEPSCI